MPQSKTPCLLAGILLSCLLSAQTHPRLLIDAADIPDLRSKVTYEPWASMMNALVSVAELKEDDLSLEYNDAESAYNCAFLYMLTGDDSWAAKARTYVENRIYDTTSDYAWAGNVKGLSLYWIGMKVSFAYDLCYEAPSWDEAGADPDAFRKIVSQKLLEMGEKIWLNGGTQQNTNKASNWQGIRGAAGGICLLATDEYVDPAYLEGSFNKVHTYLAANMGTDLEGKGWNIEAIGYTMYPWGFVGPFGIAATRSGLGDIRDATPFATDFALWTVYSATARIHHMWFDHYGVHPDFSDDNNTHRGEGAYGLAYYYCPEALHPGLSWWYDSIVGWNGDQTWDKERSGVIYSILYHPGDAVVPADPLSIPEWRDAMLETGGNGYFTFRDRYLNGNDMIAQVYAKFRGNAGHNGPDALNFRIVGLDTCFVTGGGRYGIKTASNDTGVSIDVYKRSQNGPYPVDPDNEISTNGNAGYLVDVPQFYPDGGGTVSLGISANNVDANNHRRRFLADYSAASGARAVYVVADTTDDGEFWQLCTPEFNSISTTANTITISASNGASLKATVIYPATPVGMTTGTRLRGSTYGYKGVRYDENDFAHFQSADGDYLVVMTVVDAGETHPPVSSLSGTGVLNRVLQVGGLTVHVDGDRIGKGMVPNILPTAAITSPAEGTPFAPFPADVLVQGTASDGDGTLQKVEVYSGYDYLGEAALAGDNWSMQLTGMERGVYKIRAKATDDRGDSVYSDWLTVSVHATLPPILSIPYPIENALLATNSFPVEVDAWDPDGSIAEINLYLNGNLVGTSASAPHSFPQSGLTYGAHIFSVEAVDDSGEAAWLDRTVIVARGEVDLPWMNFDIGDVAAAGSAGISGQDFTISGSGNDIWNNQSEFHFAGQPIYGDAEIAVHMQTQTNTNSWAKAGLMVRQNLSPGSTGANICVTPSNGVTFQYRTSQDGSMSSIKDSGYTVPVWLKLVKSGNLITGYRSSDGINWIEVGNRVLDMPDPVYMGLCITSHNDGAISTATGTFANPGGIVLADPVPTRSYAEFLDAYFTPAEQADPLISGESADVDKDGLGTLQEYLHGLDPKMPSPGHGLQIQMEPSSSGLYPVVRFERAMNHPDVTWSVVARADFTNPGTTLGSSDVQMAPLGNARFQVVARRPDSWPAGDPVFFQLEMSNP
ncbi:MAG: Ig-like domain-containing protein [Oceanipulchritudo sp.]